MRWASRWGQRRAGLAHATVPPNRATRHRPKWWIMFDIVGWAEDWSNWYRDCDKFGLSPMPWMSSIIWVLTFPLWFPMHAADLAELAAIEKPSSNAKKEPLSRKSAIRINGHVIDL